MSRRREREDIAMEEVGRTQITPACAACLVATFLLLIVGVPLIQHLAPTPNGTPTGLSNKVRTLFQAGPVPTPAALKTFETQLEDDAWLRHVFLGPVQTFLTGRLGVGNEQVIPGRDGRLFYRDGVASVTGKGFLDPVQQRKAQRAGRAADPIAALVHFQQQLAARNIHLVVVPAPSKVTVHPRDLAASAPTAPRNASFPLWRERMEAADVLVFDPLPTLQSVAQQTPAYLRMDTHWSPAGMTAVAKALAEAVVGRGLISRGDGGCTISTQTLTHGGDILAMLGLPKDQTLFPPETVTLNVVDGPVGSPDAAVLVLGDSFSNIYAEPGLQWGEHAGFVEHLAAALHRPIDRITINDQGAFASRNRLAQELARGERNLDKVKLVIYQFAERELSLGDWRLIPLPQDAATPTAPIAGGPVRVRGVVAARTRVTHPEHSPYADALTATALHQVQALDGGQAPKELVVFHWGMRDRRVLDHGAGVGDVIEFELVPYESVSARLGAFQRLDLTDEAYLYQPWYWSEIILPSPPEPVAKPVADTPSAPKAEPVQAKTQPEQVAQVDTFATRLQAQYADENGTFPTVVQGPQNWLFTGPELHALTAGRFWGDAALTACAASNPQLRDPLPAILDFHQQLKAAGIDLILLPVPPKAAMAAPLLLDGARAPEATQDFAAFYDTLRSQGVQVLDMSATFARDPEQWYLKGDTHWSPQAVAETARQLAGVIRETPWLVTLPRKTYARKTMTLPITGDLQQRLGASERDQETVTMELVLDGEQPPAVDRDSPVLVIGDSHTLVFHAGGDLFASGAGLPDRLAAELGFPMDLIGVRGSGSTAVRLNLMRRRDNLVGKRMVIWCFAAREFTQSTTGWRKVPVIR